MLSRRDFLTTTAAAGAAIATQVSQKAAAQVDRRMIVDAQIHLWKAESEDWKWVPGLQPQLPIPFTIERAISMMDEAGVDRAVIVPPSWPGDRNDYALEAVKRYPDRFRVMGKLPLQDAKSLELLPKWKEQQGMLGVRVIFNNAQTIPWLTDGTADRFWPAAEKAGLPVMCFAPGRTVALAKHPNISVKVSASPGLSRQPYPFRDVADYVKRVFDAYGPQRSYWGTDITNSYAKASYRQRITQFTEELSFLSESDKDQVMGRAIVARLKWT
jgi:predicted TIM-barrel fold metal-dependent hydrolase